MKESNADDDDDDDIRNLAHNISIYDKRPRAGDKVPPRSRFSSCLQKLYTELFLSELKVKLSRVCYLTVL